MSDIDKLLDRLEGMKHSAEGRWLSRCPAHEDRSPSLAIRELPDGRILLHCFAGCETESVLAAVGLQFSDLFPERVPDASSRRTSIGLSPREMMEVIDHELTVASLILADVADAKSINEQTWARFCKAAQRIQTARDHGR